MLLKLKFHSVVSLTGVPSGLGVDSSVAQSSTTIDLHDLATGQFAELTFSNSDSSPQPDLQFGTAILHTTEGAQLQLFQQMLLVAGASEAVMLEPLITASVDAGNTSSAFLDVLTPRADLVTASGASYSSSTPEPDSLLLLGSGLIGLGVARQRGRKVFG